MTAETQSETTAAALQWAVDHLDAGVAPEDVEPDYEDLPHDVAGTTVLKRDEGADVRWFVLEEDLDGDGFRPLGADEIEALAEL